MSIYSECGHAAYGNHCPQCAAAAGAAEERAKIVAWLRENEEIYDWSPPTIAAAIIDEEHL